MAHAPAFVLVAALVSACGSAADNDGDSSEGDGSSSGSEASTAPTTSTPSDEGTTDPATQTSADASDEGSSSGAQTTDGGDTGNQVDVGIWVDITPPVSLDFASPPDNYGTLTIASSASAPGTLYLGTCYQGIWKSTDRGDTWAKVNTGDNGANLDTGRNWTLAVDPTDADVLYTVAGYGAGQGLWKSNDGGVSWAQLLDDVDDETTADVYSVAVDPDDHLHLLVGSHSGWAFGSDSGVLESDDGGASWTLHPPQGAWGAGHYVHFIDASTWLLATQNAGHWRTANAGDTWTKVSDGDMQHGASMLYRASTGVLYAGGLHQMLRSDDDGASWTSVGPETSDGYHAVIGDGTFLYAQPANTGTATAGPNPFYVSSEDDGIDWQPYNEQMFADGPMAMVFDAGDRTIYASSWGTGVWRLATGN